MKVLISGASIAGPTTAYWLTRAGHEVTVVERAARPREGGAPIDVRGEAVEVAERMGVLDRIRSVRTNTQGILYVDRSGRRSTRLYPGDFAENPGRDIELERADLVSILYDAAKDDAEYVFEDSIETLAEDSAGVDVTFARGGEARFDLVVGADGLHSVVRGLAFGPGGTHHLGMYVALVPVDPALGRADWGVMHNSPGRVAGVYSHRGSATGFFMFRSPELSYDYRDVDQQKKLLISEFAGEGWQVPRLLDAVRATDDFYFDSVSQVRMPSWTRGRVALVGDAGYCPALLSGMGTTLAMVGATALADALAAGDHRAAFARYDLAHRPLVDHAQAGVMRSAAVLIPATRFGIWSRNQLTKLLPLAAAARRSTRRRAQV
ncbi:MAG: monooxygenase [Actinophytocola sp.]|uniref:FAD-dependent monooxygenase n=1 Tax=Actinophytocola sp. TaxID=1872138 RepID=UPI0013294F40|nr:FAD-dependent monooxygenase [Actinophytocola sp.]MPZ80109.1 monooxygenase [Actinophytocola sp.]